MTPNEKRNAYANMKPHIRLHSGRWEWIPRFGDHGSDRAANVAACYWCVKQNIKEGRY